MKILFLSLLMLASACIGPKTSKTQNSAKDDFGIIGKTWRANSFVGLIDASKIELTEDIVREGQSPFYNGAKIIFNTDGSFKSYNTAQCGNDCFITVRGHYRLLKDSKIEINTKDIQKGQYCDKSSDFKSGSYIYTLQQSGEKIILTK